MGGRLATSFAIALLAIVINAGEARGGEDDLALDLGSASDKPVDGGVPLRKLELRRIPKGTFVQGADPKDPYREPDEVQRNVTISHTFWMGKYPITRAQFARFVAETRHQTDAEKGQSGGFGWDGVRLKQDKLYTWRNPGFTQGDNDPVTLVTFGDANAFTAWASRKTGRRVRLPTEAEFEYSARGGTTTPWYAAKTEEEAAATVGWYRPPPGGAVGTHSVGQRKANPFGLFDMSGNVNQWCRDVYALWPATDVVDPEQTTNTGTDLERRVLRGGSWMRDPRRGRSASRYRNAPGTRNADNGFRVVVEDAPVIAPVPGATAQNDVSPAPSVIPAAGPSDAGPAIAPPPPVVRQSTGSEGFSWALLVAPACASSFVIAWMFARRKRDDDVPSTVRDAAPPPHSGAVKPQISYHRPVPPGPITGPLPPLPPSSSPSVVPRSPWPSDRGASQSGPTVPPIPLSERRTSAAPPAVPSGPPAPLPDSGPVNITTLPLSDRRISVPPAVPSGPPPPPFPPLVSGPPPPPPALVSGPPPPPLVSVTPPAPLVSGPPAPLVTTPPPSPLGPKAPAPFASKPPSPPAALPTSDDEPPKTEKL